MSTAAFIGLGSNLGDRKSLLDFAVAALSNTPDVALRAVSSYRETPPAGGPSGQGAFLNAAAMLETALEPEALLDRLHAIESEAGRTRTDRWAERTLDLDLLLFGDRVIQGPRLKVPHPRMALRRFVLAPLAEIAPEVVDTTSFKTIRGLLENVDRRPSHVAISDVRTDPFRKAVFEEVVRKLDAVAVLDDSEPDSLELALARRTFLLNTATSATGLSRERWLVSDFTILDLDLDATVGIPSNRMVRAWIDRYAQQQLRTLPPTFEVHCSQYSAYSAARDDRFAWPPRLNLGPITLKAAVDEILATCTATRAG